MAERCILYFPESALTTCSYIFRPTYLPTKAAWHDIKGVLIISIIFEVSTYTDQSPDFPPFFANTLTPSMYMRLSTALHMS